MLSLDLEAEVVTQTSVFANLLHALQVFSETSVNHVGDQLGPSAILDAPLPVEEPLRNVVLIRLGKNVTKSVHFFFREFSGSAALIDLCNFATQHAKAATNTLDASEGERNLVLSIHVCVLHS